MSWPMFHQVERCERLLDDMMNRVGVRPQDAVRRSAGVEFLEAPTQGGPVTFATLKDPEGNYVQLIEFNRSA